MPEAAETKPCPACAEIIKAAAKICPHCRTKQVRFALWREEILGALVAVLFMVTLTVAIAFILPEDSTEGRSFAGHQADLTVGKLKLEKGKSPEEFRLTGVITNRGPYSWRVWEIEVRLRTQNGEMIDVQHAKLNQSFVVQPAGEGAFSYSLWRLHPGAATARLEARVQKATDGNKPLDSD